MNAPQPITLQISLLLDEQGNLTAAIPSEGEDISIDRAAVKASSRTLIKRSEGAILGKRIREAMDNKGLSVAQIADKVSLNRQTVYNYLNAPGKAPLSVLLSLCRAAGIRQITLDTGGQYQ